MRARDGFSLRNPTSCRERRAEGGTFSRCGSGTRSERRGLLSRCGSVTRNDGGLSKVPRTPKIGTGSMAAYAKTGGSTGLKKAIPLPEFATPLLFCIGSAGSVSRRFRHFHPGFGRFSHFHFWYSLVTSPRDAAPKSRRELSLARKFLPARRWDDEKGLSVLLAAARARGTSGGVHAFFSLRLGHAAALTVPRTVIHSRRAAALPPPLPTFHWFDRVLRRNERLYRLEKSNPFPEI